MKTQLAIKLKELLDSMPQEEFNADWNNIQSLNLLGPTLSTALNYFSINQYHNSSFEIIETDSEVSVFISNNNYTTAA